MPTPCLLLLGTGPDGYPLLPEISLGVLVILVLALVGTQASTPRLEISPDNQQYRRCFRLLGLKIGQWQVLPLVVGVTLKCFSEHDNVSLAKGTSHVITYKKLVVMLSLHNSATGLIVSRFSVGKVELARATARQLAIRFGVPVHEYLMPKRS